MNSPASSNVHDTRDAGGRGCAELTTEAFVALEPGASFELVADHDPTPLEFMLTAEHPGQMVWTAIEGGPNVWRVEVSREAS